MKYIVVQIPCYRDEEVLPTIVDCLNKADNPKRLRFAICWQKDKTDTFLNKYQKDSRFKILNFDFRKSHGVCWARHKLQKIYDGEDFILQIDSHHRFARNWDRILLRAYKECPSDNPILTACGTPYFTNPGYQVDIIPTKIGFDKFSPQGALLQKPVYMYDYKKHKTPVPARFLSSHFVFAPGKFIDDCPIDPGLYFHGEEMTMAVRAFTHGYDLFHPNKLVLWHLYERTFINQHCYDHDPWQNDYKPFWSDLEVKSVKRYRKLLSIPGGEDEPKHFQHPRVKLGKYKLGEKRSLRDYEKFAGVNFNLKAVQRHTLVHELPPNPPIMGDDYDWKKSFEHDFKVIAEFESQDIDTAANDCLFWYVGLLDKNNKEIYRKDLHFDKAKHLLKDRTFKLSMNISSYNIPNKCIIWPYSTTQQWMTRSVKQITLQ